MSRYIEIGSITEDNKWVNLDVEVVQLWQPEHESISQVGLLSDASGRVKFVSWKKSDLPLLEEKHYYRVKNAVVNFYEGKPSISLNRKTEIIETGQRTLL